ncbi:MULTISPECIES: hypothetical protein [Micromonospora]|uniref:hypothetical protein n=1 Tax=Micromonospora TaxID=1873 RepID=UPI001F24A3CA|nr:MULTISPECIES: hypothetical protein [Micromonospora]
MSPRKLTMAAALLLVPLAVPGGAAQAAGDAGSGPTVTRIVALDSAPAAQQAAPAERPAARAAVDRARRRTTSSSPRSTRPPPTAWTWSTSASA